MRVATWLLVLVSVAPAALLAQEPTRIPEAAIQAAAQLRTRALADDTAWQVVESLTTQVGPRMAGSEADARAVAWAQAKLKALGYDKVWTEPVTFPKWVRRSEHAEVLGAHAQPLAVTALGLSAGGTVEGEVVRFADLDALEAAPDGSLAGKIAFVDFRMQRERDGSGYGAASRIRGSGPSAAIRKGAIGYLMRSAGTDWHRNPHTGMTRYADDLTPIPAAALANPDADQLARLLALGPTQVRLALDVGFEGDYTSQNVIGEITGTQAGKAGEAAKVVVIGGHLDSWDPGTGAIDDGAGIAITMAAGHLIGQMKERPAHTIRVIAFANEEQGLHGGRAYAAAHAEEIAAHLIGAESDFGAGRIHAFASGAFDSATPEYAKAAIAQIAAALEPLGVKHTPGTGGPGPDLIPIVGGGMAWASLEQDGTDYFDYHHTPDDTLDKIDPAALQQNVAVYAVFAYLAAQADGDFGSAARPAAAAGE